MERLHGVMFFCIYLMHATPAAPHCTSSFYIRLHTGMDGFCIIGPSTFSTVLGRWWMRMWDWTACGVCVESIQIYCKKEDVYMVVLFWLRRYVFLELLNVDYVSPLNENIYCLQNQFFIQIHLTVRVTIL